MGISTTQNFKTIYRDYLEWFQSHAVDGACPKDEEELAEFQMVTEDSFDGREMTLSRVFFFVPLLPFQSRSGRLEIFAFSELNFIRRIWNETGVDDIAELVPVEYRRE